MALDPRGTIRTVYQRYLVSFVLSGDPNKFKTADAPDWPMAKYAPVISEVLSINDSTNVVPDDPQVTGNDCNLWYNTLGAATNAAGM